MHCQIHCLHFLANSFQSSFHPPTQGKLPVPWSPETANGWLSFFHLRYFSAAFHTVLPHERLSLFSSCLADGHFSASFLLLTRPSSVEAQSSDLCAPHFSIYIISTSDLIQVSIYLWLNSLHSSSRFAFINAFSNSTSVFNKQLTFNMVQSQTRFPLSSVPPQYHSPL